VDNLIHLFLFANVFAVALFAVGTCLVAVKTKLDTFDEVALLRALVLALVTVVLSMCFSSSRRSTAPARPPPGPDPERGHVLGPPPKYNKHAANDLNISSDPNGEGDEYKHPAPAPRPTPDASRRARSMRSRFRPSSHSSRYRHRMRRVRARTVTAHPRADFACSRFARFLFPAAPTVPTPHPSLAPDDEIVYAMGAMGGGSQLKKAKTWPTVNDKNASYFISTCAPATPRRAPAPDPHDKCFIAMMATGDDETFNHKLHLCPTFSGECGIAFNVFQRAFSVSLSAIQETGDEYDLNETRMGLDAGGDTQMEQAAANGTPALLFPPAARVQRNRRNKLLFKHIYTHMQNQNIRNHIQQAYHGDGCAAWVWIVSQCDVPITDLEMASLEADWLNLSFSSVGVGIIANTIFLFVSEMHNLNSFRPADKQKNEHDFCLKLLDEAKKNGANSAFALKATEELKAGAGQWWHQKLFQPPLPAGAPPGAARPNMIYYCCSTRSTLTSTASGPRSSRPATSSASRPWPQPTPRRAPWA